MTSVIDAEAGASRSLRFRREISPMSSFTMAVVGPQSVERHAL
jgi:hypothetical protein